MKHIAPILLIALAATAHADSRAGLHAYVKGDYETARKELSEAAAENDAMGPGSLYLLAELYHRGQGGGVDMERAIEHYDAAAKKGSAAAKSNLGYIYLSGEGGVQANTQTGLKYLESAMNQEHWQETDKKSHLVVRGGSAATLGVAYYQGKQVEQDLEKAALYFKFGAELGNRTCAKFYGSLIEAGHGGEDGAADAFGWYSFAAREGDRAAPSLLAKLKKRLGEDEIERGVERAKEIEAAIKAMREQDGADQPATAPESKTGGKKKTKPESKVRSR